MAIPLDERLKNTITEAFRRQREFTNTFKREFPVIQNRLIKLAEISAGTSITGQNLAALSEDLQTAVASLQNLAALAEQAVTEANVAAMGLKEMEAEPEEITELLVDEATLLANADIHMQSNVAFIVKTLSFALPKPRREALRQLKPPVLAAWLDDILEIVGQADN